MLTSVNKLLDPVSLPRMVKVRQKFNANVLKDPKADLLAKLSRPEISSGRNGSPINWW